MSFCQHIFNSSGPGAQCARCGASLLSVQVTTQRPSEEQTLHDKLAELGAAPRSELVTRDEHAQSIRELYAALNTAFGEFEAKMKGHIESRLVEERGSHVARHDSLATRFQEIVDLGERQSLSPKVGAPEASSEWESESDAGVVEPGDAPVPPTEYRK